MSESTKTSNRVWSVVTNILAVVGIVAILMGAVAGVNHAYQASEANQKDEVERYCALVIALRGGEVDDLESELSADGNLTAIWHVTGGVILGREVECVITWDKKHLEAEYPKIMRDGMELT